MFPPKQLYQLPNYITVISFIGSEIVDGAILAGAQQSWICWDFCFEIGRNLDTPIFLQVLETILLIPESKYWRKLCLSIYLLPGMKPVQNSSL